MGTILYISTRWSLAIIIPAHLEPKVSKSPWMAVKSTISNSHLPSEISCWIERGEVSE